MPSRESIEKPNRSLVVTWNAKQPLLSHFKNNYSYIAFPIVGNFTALLEDVRSKEKGELELRSDLRRVLYIPTYIAHTVIAKEPHAILLVIASSPSSEEDEISYQLQT
jgi:hypothetical protein